MQQFCPYAESYVGMDQHFDRVLFVNWEHYHDVYRETSEGMSIFDMLKILSKLFFIYLTTHV